MTFTEKELQLLYSLLRVVNAAMTNYKLDVIRKFLTKENSERTELDATFDLHDDVLTILRRVEKALNEPAKKRAKKKKRKGRKNEPGT